MERPGLYDKFEVREVAEFLRTYKTYFTFFLFSEVPQQIRKIVTHRERLYIFKEIKVFLKP